MDNRTPLNSKFYILYSRPGFTLIEVIIYIALFSVVMSFVLVVFYQMIGSQDQHRNRVEVDQEANFMMQKLLWALTGAERINQPTSSATSSILSLDKFNYGQNPIVFDVAGLDMRISKASSTPTSLGSKRIFVEELLFEHVPAVQNAPDGVKIKLRIVSSGVARPQASTTLEHTVYLR